MLSTYLKDKKSNYEITFTSVLLKQELKNQKSKIKSKNENHTIYNHNKLEIFYFKLQSTCN